MKADCLFCQIAARTEAAAIVFEDEISLAFLDNRPLFPGHCLLIPRQHYETLLDLPAAMTGRFFETTKKLTRAVERAMEAEGSFVAMNNKVSQSVPHLHVHIVPRRKKDGLKGFFWPRRRYDDGEHMTAIRHAIQEALREAQ